VSVPAYLSKALTGVALAAVLAVPTLAGAQDYRGYDNDRRGDDGSCQQDQTDRAIVGGVIGGVLGAVVGSSIAGHGDHTGGAIVGGGFGGVAGAAVGAGSATCDDQRRAADEDYDQRYDHDRYGDDRYGRYDRDYESQSFQDHAANSASRREDAVEGYVEQRQDEYGDYDDDTDYAYDRDGRRYPLTGAPGADGCALAQSTIRMPDGDLETRSLRACRDANGEYQVVE
jgi:hypothetical protein